MQHARRISIRWRRIFMSGNSRIQEPLAFFGGNLVTYELYKLYSIYFVRVFFFSSLHYLYKLTFLFSPWKLLISLVYLFLQLVLLLLNQQMFPSTSLDPFKVLLLKLVHRKFTYSNCNCVFLYVLYIVKQLVSYFVIYMHRILTFLAWTNGLDETATVTLLTGTNSLSMHSTGITFSVDGADGEYDWTVSPCFLTVNGLTYFLW